MEKRDTNYGHMGLKFEKKSRLIWTFIYILVPETKTKHFGKMSIRPSAKLMYTKTEERMKIIKCGKVCTGNRKCQNFDSNERTPTY